jgi:hypothetical protein
MKKISFLFFVMLALVLPNVVQAQDVVITEIMYNPPESGVDSLEFIEVFNPTALPINMDGYYFSNGVTYTFGNVTINSGDYYVVAIDSIAIGIVYGTDADAEFSGGLSNGGESIALKNSLGVTVDSVNFDDSGVWPSGSSAGQPDGGGASLRLCDALLDNNDGANWSAATEVTGVIINGFEVLGSPGAASVCPCVNTTSMITESACITYTVPSGDETYTMSGMYMDTIPNAAGCDSIMTINLTINAPTSSTDVITACDTYTWIDGLIYTASNNTATFTDMNAAGCDSVITLDLTINTLTTSTTPITACDSYTVPSGDETYTMSGMYMDTIPNAAGCDSIMTINLVVNTSTSSTDVITACDAYTWIDGVEYTSSNNTATFTDMNTAGCDSIITLDLTINSSSSSTDVIAACDTYTWLDGNPYTASNSSATFTYMNALGCDSIVTLDLTINNSNTGTDVQIACAPFLWIDGVTYPTANNTATFTETNAAGCDSVVTLNLTFGTPNTGVDVQNECAPFVWADGNTYTTDNSTATYTTTNASGCDSVVTLNLTVILDTPPVADSTSLVDVTDECSVASITAPTATDVCSGALTGVPDVTFPITAQGTTIVTWTFDDGTGNTTTQTQNVIIEDVTPPTASNPNGVAVQCSGDVPVPNIAFVTDEADNCTAPVVAPVVAFVSDVSDGQTCPETITRTFSVTDAVGLSINVTQTIIVNDIVAPVADDNALAILSDLCSVTPQVPTATDNCAVNVVGTSDVTFPITALGITTVTWTYTDDCGNQSTQTQDVNIIGIDVTTSVANDLLTLLANNYTPGSGITYQWIDCTADSVLTGQTNHNFTPTYSSDFAVIITENGCTDTSTCVTVEGASLEDLILESIELYPNPNRGTFTIKMTDFQGETPFKIVDLLGKEVLNSVLVSETTIVELDVEPGIYYVVLKEGTQRVVVQ